MSRAKKARDIEGLATSIQRAKKVGVGKDILMVMTGHLADLKSEALEQAGYTLANAVKEESIEALTTVISQAEQAGISNWILAKANARLQVLLQEAEVKQDAEYKCMAAAESDDADLLLSLIVFATTLGVGEETLKVAHDRLQTLRNETKKRREAEDEISRAEKAMDIETFATSIQPAKAELTMTNARNEECFEAPQATDSHVEQAWVLMERRKRLQMQIKIAKQKQEAEEACEKLAQGKDSVLLGAAIDSGTKLGITIKSLKYAMRRLQAVRYEAEAEKRSEPEDEMC